MQHDYDPRGIETAAQAFWDEHQSFKAVEDPAREKFYCLAMFPYPSGRLHMGHVRNYTIGDVIARYQRMQGKNVLQPMGWDAFGLPAENAAIKNGIPPSQWTRSNVAYMKGQLRSLGFGYDWDRELATCDPDYYRWEQWLFTRLMAKGLAYRATAVVNWDPIDQTVLANEQVIDGRGWRSGAPVQKREIEQWSVRITDYAQELLDALDGLTGWPEQVRTMQRNWIGRSEGVYMEFGLAGSAEVLGIYTTRPDTVMGVTYMAVAAEHPLARRAAETDPGLAAFIEECRRGGVSEAEIETMEKRGYPLGLNAIHPVTNETVPIFAANFVLMGYGTGAVMAVPAHDQRDWEFAEKYGVPKRQVIHSPDGSPCGIEACAYVEKGVLRDSGPFDGLTSAQACDAIATWLQERGKGEKRVNFRLRDWGVSRQRYWGCPIPVVRTPDGGVRPETNLPVLLPEDVVVDGSGSPLKRMPSFSELPNGEFRETDTFDTFFESSWYYARFCSSDCTTAMLDERARYWLPVDQYVGGIEHAVLHLLYARFFHKLMRDEGLVDCDEPFTRLLTQGMVVAETWYRGGADGRKEWFNPADVEVTRDDKGKMLHAVLKADGQPVLFGGIEKMSKSKNNGVDPESLIARYGADTVRLYTMFTSPPDQSLEWNDDGVEGAYRFLKRLWTLASAKAQPIGAAPAVADLAADLDGATAAARREVQAALKKSLFDYERQQYNTVVSGCMTMVNALYRLDDSPGAQAVLREGVSICLRLLAPIAPHVTHHLWQELGFGADILDAPWPAVDEAALRQDSIEYVLQVNGKLRGKVTVAADADRAAVEAAALAADCVRRYTQVGVPGTDDARCVTPQISEVRVRKVIVVPGKLVNVVVN
ncbi:leucine--tRNA ligase [Candidatus Thiodictyon syntrophicum]|jgi:leucyl-tRNA synthetase|uniref:Leucine--tRNA ligase n=1 Tax=Candidatus Thiodictyon syntrophicum TaxID=1166950 RepID=A0A2K8UFT2_9GAMM|nr:leucine--tRNA ligase [Candidatus Thiodictyon syntrophicum]AUB84410.1 leucine--tRNA ligase [Candidatus Thiodictyon syntrophicum]